MLCAIARSFLLHVAVKSTTDEFWQEESVSLLQFKATRQASRDLRPSNDTNVVHLGRDEPMKWPDELEYPVFNIPIPIHIFIWSFAGFLPSTGTSQMGNCTVDYSSQQLENQMPMSPDYDISDADVVLFAVPNMLWAWPTRYVFPREKKADQMWITSCEEPFHRDELAYDCRLVQDEATMELMDATSSYDASADIQTLFDTVYVEDLKKGPPDFSATPSDELATVAHSDCATDFRNSWLEEIMAEIAKTGHKVLSYGRCFHNTDEFGPGEDSYVHPWMDRAAARPFKLVGENVLQPWYVTEKIWNALAEGSVPVYLGAPEVKQMLPEGSFLYADDFPSTQALVQRMLDFTPEDFAKAHAWRDKPTSEWGIWKDTWLYGRHTMMNRICEFAAKQKMEGKEFKSGTTPAAHDLPCCPADPTCCLNGQSKSAAL